MVVETVRPLRTPEGVVIPFALGGVAERGIAFVIDVLIIHVTVLLLVLGWSLLAGMTGLAFALLLSFFLRNFYFVVMELRWAGMTVGKRIMGLRVIARDGGPLTVEAIFARNLTRDLEVFLPLVALTQPALLVPGGPGWGMLLATGWLLVFAILPLLNRERLRCGDLVGGTIVVKAPPVALLGDLVEERALPTGDDDGALLFTPGQLDMYGVHELHTLESVLRASDGFRHEDLVARVAETIKTKIAWPRNRWDVDDHAFLLAFYRAQRAYLEGRLAFGERRERKRDAARPD